MSKDATKIVHLQQGEIYISDKPAEVRILLGSCIGITFFSHRLKLGAASHIMFPGSAGDKGAQERYKYAEDALEEMTRFYLRMDIAKEEIEMRVFGGGKVIQSFHEQKELVGQKNLESALAKIKELGLKIKSRDVGGEYGRMITFMINTGKTSVRKICTFNPDPCGQANGG